MSRQLSPDGRYWWDGKQWQLIPEQAVYEQPAGPAPPRKPRRRWPWIAGGLIALVLVIIIAASAANGGGGGQNAQASPTPGTASHAPTAAPTHAPSAAPTAKPFTATDGGVTVTVSNVQYDAPNPDEFSSPESGNVWVTMTVTFTNNGGAEYNANPTSFVLEDAAGVKHTYDAMAVPNNGGLWEPVNLTKGASISKPLGFQATAGQPSGLTLVWTPSLFGSDHNIKLS